jgi:hypothetical protein
MTIWETPEEYANEPLEFQYLHFTPDDKSCVDLDQDLLDELIRFFVSLQLDYWREVNRIAHFRFPGRQVPSYIRQVKDFVEYEEDGFVRLFGEYLVYFIFLRHIHSDDTPCTQKRPHLKPTDHYADHIAAWPNEDGKYQIVFTEVKTTKQNARRLIRDKAFDEFRKMEEGELDRDVKADVNALDWYFIESEEQARKLVESLFWKKSGIYHACTVSLQSGPNIFAGYEDVAAKNPNNPERRWATVVLLDNWENWGFIRKKTKQFIEVVKNRGRF